MRDVTIHKSCFHSSQEQTHFLLNDSMLFWYKTSWDPSLFVIFTFIFSNFEIENIYKKILRQHNIGLCCFTSHSGIFFRMERRHQLRWNTTNSDPCKWLMAVAVRVLYLTNTPTVTRDLCFKCPIRKTRDFHKQSLPMLKVLVLTSLPMLNVLVLTRKRMS